MVSVSVAMATYNGSRFVGEQLESIAAQTALPAELVVTDDASGDETLAVVRRFAERAPFPVHVHENPTRLGYRANFMRAVNLCTGDLIALCDQDDVWDPRKLEVMALPFAEPEVLLAFHEARLIDDAGRPGDLARIYPLPDRNPPLSLFPMRNPFGFSMVFRRELLAFSDLWDRSVDNLETAHRMAHDQWFFFLASTLGTIAHVGEPLAGYRQHENNTYGVDRPARTRRDRIARWMSGAPAYLAAFAAAAAARALVLEAMRGRVDGQWADRAAIAADSYRQLTRQCALRSDAYGAARLPDRLGAWLRLVRAGGYGAKVRWASRRRTGLKDLAYLAVPRRWAGIAPTAEPGGPAGRRDDPGRA